MNRSTPRATVIVSLFTGTVFFIGLAQAGTVGGERDGAEVLRMGLRGVHFVENQGQWSDESVHYGLTSRGVDVAFRESSFTMHLTRSTGGATSASRTRGSALPRFASVDDHHLSFDEIRDDEDSAPAWEHLTLTLSFPGSNPVAPRGARPQAAKFNYFVGGEGRGTASNVPSFGAVIYENLYEGIDLHIAGNDDGVLKYEFHCAPGADYTQIQIQYDGIDSLCVNADGDLEIATSFGTLRDGAPIAWQEESEGRASGGAAAPALERTSTVANGRDARSTGSPTLPARFELIDDHTYRIALDGAVDPTRTLVLDPEVEWMTYLGGSAVDVGYRVALDGSGHVYVSGHTTSTDFEGRLNSHHGGHSLDLFVVKVDAEGSLAWMTYLGGSAYDEDFGIAVDGSGNALLTGNTVSTDFEGRLNSHHGGTDDAFVLKLDPAGGVQWMLYLGGSATDYGFGLTVDGSGNAYMAGRSRSTDFEGRTNAHHGGVHDGLIAKVNAAGALQWATYVGGGGVESAIGIDLDSAGRILATGYTNSTNFEGSGNAYKGGMSDAFVVRLDSAGALQWATYLGGSAREEGYDLAVNGADESFVAAYTDSADFEGRNNAYQFEDGAVVKVSAAGAVQWMTYVGGSEDDGCIAVALDDAGDAIIAGYAQSADFTGRLNDHRGVQDAFIGKVNASGSLQWAMFAGGADSEDAAGVALDGAGHAFLSGSTSSLDFDGRTNESHGGREAYLARVRIVDGPRLSVDATCPSGGTIRIEWSGATPGGQIALLYARNTGSFRVPQGNPCAGTELGLGSNQIQLAWQGGAGANGSRVLSASTGPGACGGYMQLLDLPTCATSNVAPVQ